MLALYRTAATLAERVPLPPRIRASAAVRRASTMRWKAWGTTRPSGPLVWLHGASVGECLLFEPILNRLRADRPDLRSMLTYTSPSAARWSAWPVDHADFLPPDTRDAIGTVFDAVRPALIVISRGDLWPEFLHQAARRNVPVAIIGATLRAESARLRFPARVLYRRALQDVRYVGVVSEGDGARWRALGASGRIEVTGDPGHDRVLERTPDLTRLGGLMRWRSGRRVVIAASLEEEDVALIAEALERVLQTDQAFAAIVVPHDPRSRTGPSIAARLAAAGIGAQSWGPGHPDPQRRVVQVETPGLLADLYALGDAAYVGGGLTKPRAHSLTEPAAYATPIAVGQGARTAEAVSAFLDGGGAVAVHDAEGLTRCWLAWLRHDGVSARAGLRARGALTPGAARRTAQALKRLLEP